MSLNYKNDFPMIGCQGWNYADWVTAAGDDFIFYERGLKSGKMLEAYARIFSMVEIDSTFYAIPTTRTVENWYLKTPDEFTFCLKAPREISHVHRLGSDSFPILDSFCQKARDLEKKLGVVLIQLPPSFSGSKKNAVNLRRFLKEIPSDIRFSIEFRNDDWMIDWTYQELARANATICLVEGPWISRDKMFGAFDKLESGFVYVRFMGERDLTSFSVVQRKDPETTAKWVAQINKHNQIDTYVTFSNYYEGHAPASVNSLKTVLKQKVIEPSSFSSQKDLF